MSNLTYSYYQGDTFIDTTCPGVPVLPSDTLTYSYVLKGDEYILTYKAEAELTDSTYSVYGYCYTYSGNAMQFEVGSFGNDSNISTYGTLSWNKLTQTSTGYTMCRYRFAYNTSNWDFTTRSNIKLLPLDSTSDYFTYVKYGTTYNYFYFDKIEHNCYITVKYNTFTYSNAKLNYTIKYKVYVAYEAWNSADLDQMIIIKDNVVGENSIGEFDIPVEIHPCISDGQGNLTFTGINPDTNIYLYTLTYTGSFSSAIMIMSASCAAVPTPGNSSNPIVISNKNYYILY